MAKQLIDDLCTCDVPLQSECCQRVIWGLWSDKLPLACQQKLAGLDFNKDSYKQMLDLADSTFDTLPSASSTSAPVASVASASSLDDTQPAIPYAVSAVRGGRGGRGSGRGGRGGRGGKSNKNNKNQNSTEARWPTPRHADGPPSSACFNHHTYGRGAYHCTDPLTCGWANVPPHPRPKPVKNDKN